MPQLLTPNEDIAKTRSRVEKRTYEATDGRNAFNEWMADRDSSGVQQASRRIPLLPTVESRRVRNSLSSQTGSAGGVLSVSTISDIVEVGLVQSSAVRRVASVIRSERSTHTTPTLDDSGQEGAILGENEGGQLVDPSFGATVGFGYKFGSHRVRSSEELLRDSPSMEASILLALSRRIGRIQNRTFTTGTGNGQPMGVVPFASLGKAAASATALTTDELVDLVASVDPEYLDQAVFMMHPDILAYLRKLKDGSGRHLWKDSGLDQIPVVQNKHMSSTLTASARPVLFGNFIRGYTVRDIGDLRIVKFIEEYRLEDETGFELYQHSDGVVVDPAAIKALELAS